MSEQELVLAGLTAIVVLGIVAQWLAWRLRLPAILVLLLFGFLAGPVPQALGYHKLINPDDLLGKLLYPIISLSVAVILFEGGLTLNITELRQVGRTLRKLITIGALVTFLVTTGAARWALGLSWALSILLGSILIVTGPTVIGPLLRHVKPVGQVGPILKWEGIVIDPIGAVLALLVFEAIHQPRFPHVIGQAALLLLLTVGVGGIVGLTAAGILVLAFRRFWVADYLQNTVTLMFVLAAFTGANLLKDESGLFAVTVLGLALANQQLVPFKHILEFKESLSLLLVSSLFVLLGSRLSFSQFAGTGWAMPAFLAVMFLVARPLGVWLSTFRSNLSWRERIFLCCMAPRGIVAAAVSSVFALRLRQEGFAGADRIVPVTFAVIISTVLIYGLGALWLAQRLGLVDAKSAGYLIAGANPLARAIGKVLQNEGQQIILVDTSRPAIAAAHLSGLPAHPLSILSDVVIERIEGTGISRLLALTPNEEVNSLAAIHFSRLFGRSQVFQLAPDPRPTMEKAKEKVSQELRGRVLFGAGMTYERLVDRLEAGAIVKKTIFSAAFTYDDFRAMHGDDFVALFLVTEAGEWIVNTAKDSVTPKPGQALISLVKPIAPSNEAHPMARFESPAPPMAEASA